MTLPHPTSPLTPPQPQPQPQPQEATTTSPDTETPATGAADILERLGARAQLRALHADHDTQATGPRWDADPVPLSTTRLLPPFPVDVLPAWVGDCVNAITVFCQTPPDLAGCIALAALSAAAGGRAVVEARPGWREPVNIYTVVALPPGSRKSPVFTALTTPLLLAETKLREHLAPRIEEAELALRVAQAHAEKTARSAENATGPETAGQAMAEALDAAAALREITVPVLPQLVADDITPEAAASLLAEQGGRLAVLSDEGGIFATLAGRYSGAPNLEFFLKGHAGSLLRVNRKGRPAEHVAAPALTLGLAVQPLTLTEIATVPGFRGRGVLARILFSLPVNTVGHRAQDTPAPPQTVLDTYTENLGALVLSLHEWTDPAVLTLTPDARARLLDLATDLEPKLAPDGALGHIADWACKLLGATVRLAGLLHLGQNLRAGWGQPIDTPTLDAAHRLGTYYLAHALAVFDYMGSDPLVDDARHLLAWITRRGQDTFTRRDAYAPNRARFTRPADLDPALALLAEHGWIQALESPTSGAKGGRPASPRYAVHPAALDPQTPRTERTERTQPPTGPLPGEVL